MYGHHHEIKADLTIEGMKIFEEDHQEMTIFREDLQEMTISRGVHYEMMTFKEVHQEMTIFKEDRQETRMMTSKEDHQEEAQEMTIGTTSEDHQEVKIGTISEDHQGETDPGTISVEDLIEVKLEDQMDLQDDLSEKRVKMLEMMVEIGEERLGEIQNLLLIKLNQKNKNKLRLQ